MATTTTTPTTFYTALNALYKGMDGGRDPSTLDANTYAKGINVVTRGGFVKTRPAFVWDHHAEYPVGALIQGATVWSLASSDYIVSVHSGYIYVYKIQTGELESLGLLRDPLAQCFFAQVDRFMVIQDGNESFGGVSFPRAIILDIQGGDVFVKPYHDPYENHKMPVGTMMHYVNSRVHVCPRRVLNTQTDGRSYFVSGDIMQPTNPDTALIFDEAFTLSGGGAFALPSEMGTLGGMCSFRNAATGTGYGNLLVFGRNGVSAFDTSIPRANWTKQQISQSLFFNAGCISPWSPVHANDDVLYRSQDGLRSIRYTQASTAGATTLALANVPMSQEMVGYIKTEGVSYIPYVSTAFVNNRLFMTASGVGARYFKALISLDWANVYTITANATPAYDGIWTGHRFAIVMKAMRDSVPTTYVLTSTGRLLYVDDSQYADSAADVVVPDPDDPTQPSTLAPGYSDIESRIETGSLALMDSSSSSSPDFFTQKVLKFVELRVSDVRRTTEFKVYFRPKGYSYWAPLGSAQTVTVGESSAPQIRRKIRFSLDKQVYCDPSTKEALHNAVEFQFAIQWTGYAQIDTVWVEASSIGVLPPVPCSQEEAVNVTASATAGIELNDFSYTVTL